MKKLILIIVTILLLLLANRVIAQQMTLDSLIRWEGNKGILTKTIWIDIFGITKVTFPKGWTIIEIVED